MLFRLFGLGCLQFPRTSRALCQKFGEVARLTWQDDARTELFAKVEIDPNPVTWVLRIFTLHI